MLRKRRLAGKPGVREPQVRAGAAGRECDGHDGLGAQGAAGAGHPRHGDQPIALELQKATIVGMALSLKMRFPEESGIYRWNHDDCPRRGEPAIDLFGPRAKQNGG